MDDGDIDPDRGGDRRATFEALYAGHARAILAFAVRRTDRAEDAADVVADTFLVAWRRLDNVPAGAARLWLYGVARRVTANHRRSRGRRDRLGARLASAVAAHLVVDDHAEATSDVTVVRQALAALPPADREVLQLVAWEGLTAAQVGEVLGIPAATARTRLHRARQRLRAAAPDVIGRDRAGPDTERIGRAGHEIADGQPPVRETEAQP